VDAVRGSTRTRDTTVRLQVGRRRLGRVRRASDDLGLRFSYRWSTSATYGFVRTTTVRNVGAKRVRIATLDGLVDVLPYGLEPTLYQRFGNLTNAYKRSELVDSTARLAVYSLESPVSDRPEPEEVLRATVVWSSGLDGPVSLDRRAISRFEAGEDLETTLVTGRPGAYLVRGDFEIEPGSDDVVAGRRGRRLCAIRRRPTPQRAPLARGREDRSTRRVGPARGWPRSWRRRMHRRSPATHCRVRTTSPTSRTTSCAVACRSTATASISTISSTSSSAKPRRGQPSRRVPRVTARPYRATGSPEPGLVDRGADRRRPSGTARRGVPPVQFLATSRRPEPAVEPVLDSCRRRRRDTGRVLRGELARSLPELGGPLCELSGVSPGSGDAVRQRVDRRRPQPVPHHPRRARLGGARPGRPVVEHRLLG
jgi:hypothetical protein